MEEYVYEHSLCQVKKFFFLLVLKYNHIIIHTCNCRSFSCNKANNAPARLLELLSCDNTPFVWSGRNKRTADIFNKILTAADEVFFFGIRERASLELKFFII